MASRPALSRAARSLGAAVFTELQPHIDAATARGTQLVPLHIGDTHRRPPAHACVPAVLPALTDASLYRYGATSGEPALLSALAAVHETRAGVRTTPDEILLGVGGTHTMSCLARAVLEPGDEVLLATPCWPLAPGIYRALGAEIREVPFASPSGPRPWDAVLADLHARRTPRTRLLHVCSPNNPDGMVLARDTVRALAGFAQAHRLFVMADEVYDAITYGVEPVAFASEPAAEGRTLTVRSFSKSHALAGLRVGWAAGPADVVAAARRIAVHDGFNVPVLTQRCALAALHGSEDWLAEARDAYRHARDLTCAALQRMGLPCHVPDGATYVFPDLSPVLGTRTPQALLARAVGEGVLLTPGRAFGNGFETCVRLCFTSVPPEVLLRGLEALARAVAAGA